MTNKAAKAKLNTVIRTRVTDEIANMLQAKAIRENIDMATVIREIIYQYFEDSVNDTKIISQNIKCVPGCPVTAKAVFTTKLWR